MPHLGLAEHKSESTRILSEFKANREEIGQPLPEYSEAGATGL